MLARCAFRLTIRLAVLAALAAAAPARGQQCWITSLATGSNGVPNPLGACIEWDLGGQQMLVAPPSISGGNVQLWTGSQWAPLGGNLDSGAGAVAVYKGQLYIGGVFSTIGGVSIPGIARWNGNMWEALGLGLAPNSAVYALQVYNGLLYVGGFFTRNDFAGVSRVAGWNGSAWVNVPSVTVPNTGLPSVTSFAVLNMQLYAGTEDRPDGSGGTFRLDGSAWTHLGSSPNGTVEALCAYNGSLVAGGSFSEYGLNNPSTSGVARWDGTAWQAIGNGITFDPVQGEGVHSLAQYNGSLIAGGDFAIGQGQTVPTVLTWNGTSWSPLGLDPYLIDDPDGVAVLVPFQGELVAAGGFYRNDEFDLDHVARWNGMEWLPFIAGINAPIRAFLLEGTGMYLGGDFSFVADNGATASHVAFTNFSSVNALTDFHGFTGPTGPVFALGLIPPRFGGDQLFVAGGLFASAGGVSAPNVAQFGLGAWGPMGSGLNAQVNALQYYGKAMYAAGNFTGSGGTSLPHLAKYSLGAWVDPGAGSFNPLYALALDEGLLLIGGVPGGEGVSAWNGTSLTSWATANGQVLAMSTFNGDLIVAGNFTTIGGITAFGVARRDSATGLWSAMDQGLSNGSVNALAVAGGRLYAGGSFTSSGATMLSRLACWSGTRWVDVEGGLDGPVNALASFYALLEVGGDFNRPREDGYGLPPHLVSPYWVVRDANCDLLGVTPPVEANRLSLGASHPNPARTGAHVEFDLPLAVQARLSVLDLAGRVVRILFDGSDQGGPQTVEWDGTDARGRPSQAGIYFFHLEAGGHSLSRRVVLIR